jgi:hypothetical protein
MFPPYPVVLYLRDSNTEEVSRFMTRISKEGTESGIMTVDKMTMAEATFGDEVPPNLREFVDGQAGSGFGVKIKFEEDGTEQLRYFSGQLIHNRPLSTVQVEPPQRYCRETVPLTKSATMLFEMVEILQV